MVSMRLQKPICAPPCFSEVSAVLPREQLNCWSDWRWPCSSSEGRSPSASCFSACLISPGRCNWEKCVCSCSVVDLLGLVVLAIVCVKHEVTSRVNRIFARELMTCVLAWYHVRGWLAGRSLSRITPSLLFCRPKCIFTPDFPKKKKGGWGGSTTEVTGLISDSHCITCTITMLSLKRSQWHADLLFSSERSKWYVDHCIRCTWYCPRKGLSDT